MSKMLTFLFLFTSLVEAQGATATLTWADTMNPAGTTYNVYRANAACSPTATFTKIASAIAPKTYADTPLAVGTYCYQVTAFANGTESLPSNQAAATVSPQPPTTTWNGNLTWTDTLNPAGTTYNVYRAPGGTTTFVKIASGITTKTYTDAGLTPGQYVYYVTAVVSGIESAPSNNAFAPASPTGLSVSVQ